MPLYVYPGGEKVLQNRGYDALLASGCKLPDGSIQLAVLLAPVRLFSLTWREKKFCDRLWNCGTFMSVSLPVL